MNPMLKQALFVLGVIAIARLAQDTLPIPNTIAHYLP